MTCAMSHTSALSCPRIMNGRDILVRPLVFLMHGESKHDHICRVSTLIVSLGQVRK